MVEVVVEVEVGVVVEVEVEVVVEVEVGVGVVVVVGVEVEVGVVVGVVVEVEVGMTATERRIIGKVAYAWGRSWEELEAAMVELRKLLRASGKKGKRRGRK